MKEWIEQLPKTELHLHIEGTLEPELMFTLAQRNHIILPFKSVTEISNAYSFQNLQSFLDIYYQGMQVLIYEQDFYDLTFAYLKRVAEQNVKLVEFFFDPQAHLNRGISFKTVINGIYKAIQDAKQKFGIHAGLIMCFLRDLSEKQAFIVLEQALEYKDWIIAVGLDSAEKNNPPKKFQRVFEYARKHNFKAVAHAGEEGPPEYIWQALEILKVSRIDHGVRCVEDKQLMRKLAENKIPLTLCPLSNVKLKVMDKLANHPLKKMLDAGLCITINSDDPAYFGGYINENYNETQQALGLDKNDILQIIKNSFESSFLFSKEYDTKDYLKLL